MQTKLINTFKNKEWLTSNYSRTKIKYINEYPLHHAAESGNFFEVKRLIENIQYPYNKIDHNGNTALMKACEKGKTEIVQYLLEKGASVISRNFSGNDCLAIACLENRYDVVKLLLEHGGFDLSAKYYDNKTLLMLIAEVGDYDTLGLIAEEMPRHNDTDDFGDTALMIAAMQGHVNQIKDLIDCAVDVNFQNIHSGNTALFYAAEAGHLEVVRYLLKSRADKDIANEWGETPWFIACHLGYLEVAKMLGDK